MPDDSAHPVPTFGLLGRRRLLVLGGTALLAACSSRNGGGSATTATSSAGTTATTAGTTATTAASSATTAASAGSTASSTIAAFTAADFETLGTCILLPEKTAGPYPLDEQFDRRDITEDYEGHPLRLGFRVVDDACAPVPGATVELWHCDATGDYSAFTDNGGGKDEGEGTTFLRGSQTAGDDGIVEFLTIVPGWYRGRAVHIHMRVHLEDATVLTTQLFFDAAELATIYEDGLYADNGQPDTSNESDGIAGDPEEEGTLLALTGGATTRGTGSVALLNLGIDPEAESSSNGGGPGGGGPGGGRRPRPEPSVAAPIWAAVVPIPGHKPAQKRIPPRWGRVSGRGGPAERGRRGLDGGLGVLQRGARLGQRGLGRLDGGGGFVPLLLRRRQRLLPSLPLRRPLGLPGLRLGSGGGLGRLLGRCPRRVVARCGLLARLLLPLRRRRGLTGRRRRDEPTEQVLVAGLGRAEHAEAELGHGLGLGRHFAQPGDHFGRVRGAAGAAQRRPGPPTERGRGVALGPQRAPQVRAVASLDRRRLRLPQHLGRVGEVADQVRLLGGDRVEGPVDPARSTQLGHQRGGVALLVGPQLLHQSVAGGHELRWGRREQRPQHLGVERRVGRHQVTPGRSPSASSSASRSCSSASGSHSSTGRSPAGL